MQIYKEIKYQIEQKHKQDKAVLWMILKSIHKKKIKIKIKTKTNDKELNPKINIKKRDHSKLVENNLGLNDDDKMYTCLGYLD